MECEIVRLWNVECECEIVKHFNFMNGASKIITCSIAMFLTRVQLTSGRELSSNPPTDVPNRRSLSYNIANTVLTSEGGQPLWSQSDLW